MSGIQAEGTITEDDVMPVSKSTVCAGGIADLDDLIEKMEIGYAYLNVHTVAHLTGEVRDVTWSAADPRDVWEVERDARVEAVEGAGNPLVLEAE